jgi:hypothetical protein
VAEHVPEEVDLAALPGAAKHLGDCGLQAGVGVGDAQLDAVQATSPQRAQKLAPERLGLGLADVQAEHLPAAGLLHAVGDHQRLVAHPVGRLLTCNVDQCTD